MKSKIQRYRSVEGHASGPFPPEGAPVQGASRHSRLRQRRSQARCHTICWWSAASLPPLSEATEGEVKYSVDALAVRQAQFWLSIRFPFFGKQLRTWTPSRVPNDGAEGLPISGEISPHPVPLLSRILEFLYRLISTSAYLIYHRLNHTFIQKFANKLWLL